MQLHRVAVDDVGEFLWKYHSPEQLVRAMHTALVAHRDLCSVGIPHLDISPENILVRLSPDPDTREGFLTDFEFASLPRSESELDGPNLKTAPGDDITNPLGQQGTVAFTFLASSLLQDIRNAKPGEAVSRTMEQEIESFAWLFVFMVYKRTLEDPNVIPKQNEWRALKEEFDLLFPAGRSAEHILAARGQMTTPTANQHATEHIRQNHVETLDEHFCALFDCVWTVLVNHLPVEPMEDEFVVRALKKSPTLLAQLQTRSSDPPPLTHSDILGLFDAYLELIEEAKGKQS